MRDNCVICGKLCCGASFSAEKPDKGFIKSKEEGTLQGFFKLFQRYLEEGYSQHRTKYARPKQNNSLFDQVLNSGMLSCENCSKVLESFCLLYHQMKSIQLLLNWKLEELEKTMRTYHEKLGCQDSVNGLELKNWNKKDGSTELVYNFRTELLKKCRQRLAAMFPRVVIQDMGSHKRTVVAAEAIQETTSLQLFLGLGQEVKPRVINVKVEKWKGEKCSTEEPIYVDEYTDDLVLESKEPQNASEQQTINSITGDAKPETEVCKGQSPLIKPAAKAVIPQSCLNSETGKQKCGLCSKEFKYVRDYRVHYKSVHLNVTYKCKECGQTFPLRSSYNRHYQNVHLGVQFKCTSCNKVFPCKNNLTKHQRHHCRKLSESNDKQKCNLCDKEFLSKSNYLIHYRSIHMGLKMKCEICNKLFARKDNLRLHQRTVHIGFGKPPARRPNLQTYFCDQCGRSFGNISHLQIHLKTVHLKLRKHACNQCGKRFGLFANLQSHIKLVHLKLKEHTCDVCGKRFGRRHALQEHLKTVHWKLRELKCQVCEKSFMTSKVLKRHIKTVHQKLSEHVCNICEKKFTRNEGLKAHTRKVHSTNEVLGD